MLREAFDALLKRHRWSELFPPVAMYDDRIVYLEDNTKNAYLGAMMYGWPLFGADQSTVNRLKSVLSSDMPPGTIIQFGLLAHSDILDPVIAYEHAKRRAIINNTMINDTQKRVLWSNVTSRADFFRKGAVGRMMDKDNKRLRKQLLVVSIKVPCPTSPEDVDFDKAEEVFTRFHDGMNSVGTSLVRANKAHYLAITRAIIQPSKPLDFSKNDTDFLRDQILEPGFSLRRTTRQHLRLNEGWAKIMSVKSMPNETNLGIMNHITGNPDGLSNQLSGNYYACYTLHFPEPQKAVQSRRNSYAILSQQAEGPLGKIVKRLRIKQEGFDVFVNDLDRGGLICESQLNVILYGETKEEVDKASSTLSTYLSSYQLEMISDSIILEALFTNHLPLFPSPESTFLMKRMKTMTIGQAINFCPLLGEWGGNPQANSMLFSTRHGQIYNFDLFDSDTNFNAIVFAESGAGKSYLTQQMVCDYLAEGAKVWVVDIGRSYYKLCQLLGGEFIEFSDNSNICLNPFSNCEDIIEEVSMFETLLEKMAAPEGGLDDYRRIRLNEAIRQVYDKDGNSMTISSVAKFCQNSTDDRIKDLGSMLFNFTSRGSYGPWFEGVNNLRFNSNLVVLELEELSSKPLLQKTVLMMLMAKIENEMYLNRDGGKKIIIFDESWALFSDPMVAKFMQHGFRRARKYSASCVLVLQNIMDFYRQPGMEAIAENSAHKIILKQQAESVETIFREGRIAIDEYGKNMMKSLHTVPGWYSQIMFLRSQNYSVAEFKAPKFAQILYETKGPACTDVLRRLGNGEDAMAVLYDFVDEEDRPRLNVVEDYSNPLVPIGKIEDALGVEEIVKSRGAGLSLHRKTSEELAAESAEVKKPDGIDLAMAKFGVKKELKIVVVGAVAALAGWLFLSIVVS